MGGTWRPCDTSPQGPASWQVLLIPTHNHIALQMTLVKQQLSSFPAPFLPPPPGPSP